MLDTAPQDFLFTADRTIANATPVEAAPSASAVDFDLADFGSAATKDVAATETPIELDFDLGGAGSEVVAPVTAAEALATAQDDGVEFDVSLTESTFLGRSVPDASSFDMSSIDLDLQPKVASVPPVDSGVPSGSPATDAYDEVQVSTAVNPDFSREQTETLISPAMVAEPMADLLPVQDFSMAQAETQLTAGMNVDESDSDSAQQATVVNPSYGADDADLVPEFDVSTNEEAATKLDLAKAYEEMGDFEGASELLQEVLNEGDSAQKEKARALLAKIGA